MTVFHVTMKRLEYSHAIPILLVVVPVHASYPVRATDVIANVERRWSGWTAVGIERAA